MEKLDKQLKKCSAKNGQKSSREVNFCCQNCSVVSSSQVVREFSAYKTSDCKLVCPWCLSYQLRETSGDLV